MKKIGGNISAKLEKLKVGANEIGEQVKAYNPIVELHGWLDLQSGTKTNALSAWLQDSTHVFVCDYVDLSEHKLKPENCRFICDGKRYEVLNIDDPMNLHYQLEISLKYVGWQDGE